MLEYVDLSFRVAESSVVSNGIFHKRATKYRSLLRKMTYKFKCLMGYLICTHRECTYLYVFIYIKMFLHVIRPPYNMRRIFYVQGGEDS